MNRVNYQKELDKILERLEKENAAPEKKRLLLHSCCAPCSSYVLEYLSRYFDITVFYYNPNITEREEYEKRVEEQGRLIDWMNEESRKQEEAAGSGDACREKIRLEEGVYEPERFFELAKGLETVPEGGERCRRCYRLRLSETAKLAAREGYDYFTTTLSISPMKNAQWLNEIGQELAEAYHTAYLPSDFKKKNGYRRSVELSEQYGLYRQDYCGCIFSRMERDRRHEKAEKEGTV